MEGIPDMSWSNRDIRRLLSLIRHPVRLEAAPLGLALRHATGASSNLAAITAIIDRSLGGTSAVEKLMRECVTQCDVFGEKTLTVARKFGLSSRQFFRYRADAIAAIAQEANRALQIDQEPTDYRLRLAEMLARFDSKAARSTYLHSGGESIGRAAYELLCLTLRSGLAVSDELLNRCDNQWRLMALAAMGRRHITLGEPVASERWRNSARAELAKSRRPENVAAAFELTNMDRLEAIRRCDMPAARQAARRLSWLGRNDLTLHGMSLVVELEQACDDGKLDLAHSIVSELKAHNSIAPDFRTMARTEHARSVLAFMHGDFEEAYALALTSKVALTETEPGFALCAVAYAGRSAVQLRRDWEPGAILCGLYPNVWITGQVLAVHGRYLLSHDQNRATDCVERALQIAADQDARGALAFANASLALIADERGDHERAQRARVEAWESALTLGRQTFLVDMFSHPSMIERDLGSFIIDARFRAAISRRIEHRLSKAVGASHPNVAPFIDKLVLHALQRDKRVGDGAHAVTPLNVADFKPLLANGDNARGLSSVARTVLKGLANDLSVCVAVAQRTRIVGLFAAAIDEFRGASLDQSRRAYGAAS
jgi:hypothetical protein